MAAAVSFRPPFADGLLLGEVAVRTATCPRELVAEQVIDLLGVAPGDAILEVGSGNGRMLSHVAARLREGRIVGLNHDELWVRHARLRNRRWIASGRAEVRRGDGSDLSGFAPGSFDKAFAVHVLYFWEEPRRHLAELRRVLRAGGGLLVGFWPAEGVAPRGAHARFAVREAERLLRESGFDAVRSERRSERGHPLAWVLARAA